MTRNQTVEINHLTVLQIQYLTELEQLEKGRGTIGAVAAKCGVKHPTVSRFFKSCIEKGYLTESLEFTDKGKKMLRWHQKVQKDVREYLERSGITEGIDDVLKGMIENIDYRRLEELTKSHMRINKEIQMLKSAVDYLYKEGASDIYYFCTGKDKTDGSRRSMAENGFEPLGIVKRNKRGCYLELTIREMHAVSRINGKQMKGHLTCLKYLQGDMYKIADVKNGRIKIPLNACVFQNFDHGTLRGNLLITVSSSVGEAHMPESTARLIFKL